ncbi:hypothetical protein [Salipiger mangrovisoli]|nr:hypothetical protein [Salipiger mangrovisoli]
MAGAWLGMAAVALVAALGMDWGMFQPQGRYISQVAAGETPAPVDAAQDWTSHGTHGDETRFAALDQIIPDNVGGLEIAWTFRACDTPVSLCGGAAEDQGIPRQVSDDLCLCAPNNMVISIDATSGAETWRHDVPTETRTWVRCRGLAHVDTAGPLPQLTLPGTTVVVGGRAADNVALDMSGGVMRGFDAITGAMTWAFDPGTPEDRAALAEGSAYTRSPPTVWAPKSYDAAFNSVFMPVGTAAIGLRSVKRSTEDEKYSASIRALVATSGDERGVYQTVHHDPWDFDVPMQPTLMDFKGPPALAFGTNAGQICGRDRVTGQPLTEADKWGATPFDQVIYRVIFEGCRSEGLFTAPGTDHSLSSPGSLGGIELGRLGR